MKQELIDKTLPFTSNDDEYYRELIIEKLSFIESQCYKAYGIYTRRYGFSYGEDIPGANKADILFVEILGHLKTENYRVIKKFKGRSSLEAYLKVIISRKAIDLFRKKEGRSRAKEKAKKYGDLGEKLHDLVFVKGYGVDVAYETIKSTSGIAEPVERIEEIVESIKDSLKVPGSLDDTAPDGPHNPEQTLLEREEVSRGKKILKEIISELSPEDRLILRMRFPFTEDETPFRVNEIARMLCGKEKEVSNRIGRILSRCKRIILKNGLNLDDFL